MDDETGMPSCIVTLTTKKRPGSYGFLAIHRQRKAKPKKQRVKKRKTR